MSGARRGRWSVGVGVLGGGDGARGISRMMSPRCVPKFLEMTSRACLPRAVQLLSRRCRRQSVMSLGRWPVGVRRSAAIPPPRACLCAQSNIVIVIVISACLYSTPDLDLSIPIDRGANMAYVTPTASSSGSGRRDVGNARSTTPTESMATLNPSTRSRLFTTLSFPLLLLLALPFWWYTTSIERLPLPVDRIDRLSTATVGTPLSPRVPGTAPEESGVGAGLTAEPGDTDPGARHCRPVCDPPAAAGQGHVHSRGCAGTADQGGDEERGWDPGADEAACAGEAVVGSDDRPEG